MFDLMQFANSVLRATAQATADAAEEAVDKEAEADINAVERMMEVQG